MTDQNVSTNDGSQIIINININRDTDDHVRFQTMHRVNDIRQLENEAARMQGYHSIQHGSWTVEGEKVTSKVTVVVQRAEFHLAIVRSMLLPGIVIVEFTDDLRVADLAPINDFLNELGRGQLSLCRNGTRPATH